MATKRRKLTTPEYEAEMDARTERFDRMLLEMDARADAYRRAHAEKLERRRRRTRFIPFRRAA